MRAQTPACYTAQQYNELYPWMKNQNITDSIIQDPFRARDCLHFVFLIPMSLF